MSVEIDLAAPTFIIAVPQMGDPNFSRGVIFLLEHNDEGSMGLVLNRTSNLQMGMFCESQNMRFKGDNEALVYQGGPVQTDRAFILHSEPHHGPETEEVSSNILLSYSRESLKMIVEDPPEHLRVYLGYAGWGPGQLAEEISAGAWLLSQPRTNLVFDAPPDKVWEYALADIGIQPVQLMHSGAIH